MRPSILSLAVGLGAVATALFDENKNVPSTEVCGRHAPLVELMLFHGTLIVRPFCQQLCPSDNIGGPITVTITDTPKPSTVIDTVYHTQTRTIESVSTILATIVNSYETTVTDQLSSIAVVPVDVTSLTTDVESATATTTEIVTDTTSATITNTATLTQVNTITSYTTSTITVTATTAPVKRDTKDIPEPFRQYAAEDLRDACLCLPHPIVYKTVTLPHPTVIRTIVLPTTVVKTNVLTRTKDVMDSVTNTATVDITTIITQSSTATITSAITTQTTVSVTVDQTVEVTVTETATATVTDTGSVTTTEPVTITTTVTPSPSATCGVNLIQNPTFESMTLPPWTVDFIGDVSQQYLGGCSVSDFCILFYSSNFGTFSLTQTIDTSPGETYTMSFDYYIGETAMVGTSLSCSVNNDAATTWNVPLSVSLSWIPFSGVFVASETETTFSCTGTGDFTVIMDVFDIQC